jgi:hypothetical protein
VISDWLYADQVGEEIAIPIPALTRVVQAIDGVEKGFFL